MRANLLSWQWTLYPDGHRSRANLTLHAFTQPCFVLGLFAVLSAPLSGLRCLFGLAPMVLALALQGRGHKGESTRPVPFEGPLDFVSRFFVEQLVTWPRFVLSGGFARAWRDGAARPTAP